MTTLLIVIGGLFAMLCVCVYCEYKDHQKRKITAYHRCLAVHMHNAMNKSAMNDE